MTEALSSAPPALRNIPIELIDPSPHNPRKHFAAIDELAASIKAQGVLLPLILRPFGDRYELVAGERRWRAAKKAKLAEVPGIVRELDDKQAREVMLDENLQREDLNAIEEADGYAELMKDFGYTVKDLEVKFKRSESSIRATLKLRDLGPAGREALIEEKIAPSVGLLIARVPGNELQARAVTALAGAKDRDPLSYREAVEHIQRHFMLPLKEAPFQLTDATLVEKAGPCSTCPKRTGNQRELFPDVKAADVCTDPACYRGKVDALAEIKLKKAEEEGRAVLRGPKALKLFRQFPNGQHTLNDDSGYVKVEPGMQWAKGNYVDVQKALKKNPEIRTVLVAHPDTGAAIEVVPLKALPKPVERKPRAAAPATPKKESAEQKEKRLAEEKARAERTAQANKLVDHMVSAAEKKLDKTALLLVIDLVDQDMGGVSTVAARREGLEVQSFGEKSRKADKQLRASLPKLSEEKLRGILLEMVVVEDYAFDELVESGTGHLVDNAKALGVDVKKYFPPPAKKK